MKSVKFLFIFLYALLISAQCLNAQAADTVFINLDSLKTRAVNLDGVWKYHSGDDIAWSDPNYNDSDWDTLNPALNWGEYNTASWKGIGWFRRVLVIDSALYFKSVSLTVNHCGASEIYLNGKKIHSFGRVDANPDSEKVYIPNDIPIALNLGGDSINILSVRYSNHRSISEPERIDQWFGHHGFVMRIHEINSRIKTLINNGRSNFGVNFAIGGIFLSLSILYFLLHLFYSTRKENLYYALFSFSLSTLFFSSMLGNLVFRDLDWLMIYRIVGITGVAFTFLGYLGFIYSIFYERIPKQIWLFVAGIVVLGGMLFFPSLREYAGYLLPAFIFISAIEGLRVIILAIKNDKEHSWVIGAGVLVFVSLIILIFVINLFNLNPPEILILVLFLIGLFGLPSSMSVYLARNIATTNKKLQKQIIEIKDLSAQQLEVQKKNADLILETEREKAAKNEAVLQAKAAELQAKASEAERQALEAENARKTAELEEARQLQLSMLPKTLPDLPHLDIAVYMQTATEVGGDYYDFHVSMDGTLTAVIGDATGHGLNAGTIVTITKSLFNSHASSSNILHTFQEISHGIKEMKFKYLSMCLMILKIKDYNIQLSAAGMPPALIFRKDKNIVDELLIKGMPLGAPASFPYEIITTSIQRGDTILLMSDGFPELLNTEKKMFGYDTARQKFEEAAGKEPEEIISHLKNTGAAWMAGKDPDDDVTFVVIKVK
jgi:serine phosphatase RsbU (regulator of sigma subunit)